MDKTFLGHPDPGSVKGRIVALEFEDYYVIGTYVVNAGQGVKVCSFMGYSFMGPQHAYPNKPQLRRRFIATEECHSPDVRTFRVVSATNTRMGLFSRRH